jgi:hypothetical protein
MAIVGRFAWLEVPHTLVLIQKSSDFESNLVAHFVGLDRSGAAPPLDAADFCSLGSTVSGTPTSVLPQIPKFAGRMLGL